MAEALNNLNTEPTVNGMDTTTPALSATGQGQVAGATTATQGSGDELVIAAQHTYENQNGPAQERAAEVITFDGLVADAARAETPDDVEDVLVRGREIGLSAAKLKLLEVRLCEATGLDKSVISAAARDAKDIMRPYGNVGTYDAAARVYVTILDEDCPSEEESPGIVYDEDELSAYDERGFYDLISTEVLSADLRKTFKGRAVVRTDRDVKEMHNRIAEHYRAVGFFANAARGLPVANGFAFYDGVTGKVRLDRHSRRQKARLCLDIDFSPNATAPVFNRSLRRVLPDAKKRQALQEMMGCVMFQVVPRRDAARRMAILTGRAGSGKSTFIETVKLVLPPSVVANVPPATWHSEFARARLAGKWLNYCTELTRNKLLADDQVKQIVACETVTGRHRYGQEHEIQPIAFHVLATNTMPHITDNSGAFDRRLLVLQFDQPLDQSEMDSNLIEQIRQERPGIIAWAAEGAERLMARGAFDLPPGHAEAMLKAKFQDDVVGLFVHTQLVAAPGNRLSSSELQAALANFAVAHGYDRVAAIGSGVMRRLAGLIDGAFGAKRSASNNAPHYTGVALKG
ncbi:MAG: hypothetical protein K2Y04_14280, partial [Caulobacteraceae bacterium]|nr:hypothetical protein [Caulobacteraceae bacterium]